MSDVPPRTRRVVDALLCGRADGIRLYQDGFSHVSEGRARVDNLATSIAAVLLAEACNIGLEPVVRHSTSALTRGRLGWVSQNFIRAETLRRANALLVNHQATIPLARQWGGGEVAVADGVRFVVPVRTLHAGPNPRYFGSGRGVTYFNFSSDQFTGFHSIIVPATLRDSIFVLNGLLEQETNLRPTEVMTDTASYSDIVFGLFRLLGYQFSPRIADIGDARFWRIDRDADYGPLDGLARNRVSVDLITANWDDILRVAGSLMLGRVAGLPSARVRKVAVALDLVGVRREPLAARVRASDVLRARGRPRLLFGLLAGSPAGRSTTRRACSSDAEPAGGRSSQPFDTSTGPHAERSAIRHVNESAGWRADARAVRPAGGPSAQQVRQRTRQPAGRFARQPASRLAGWPASRLTCPRANPLAR